MTCRFNSRNILAAILMVASLLVTPAQSAPVYAASELEQFFQSDFCWDYFFVPCPDDIDFHWRTGTPFSLGEPTDALNWVSMVSPARTYFFYSPAPVGKHQAFDFGLVGYGWDWWAVPASMWWLEDGLQPGQALVPWLASTMTRYEHSSYGQPATSPRGEPGFMSRTTASWVGDLWEWHWQCSFMPPGCTKVWSHYPLVAWYSRAHAVPVRQVMPVGIGS